MASVARNKKTGEVTIQFVMGRKRKSVWLGKVTKRDVTKWKDHIEELVSSKKIGRAPYDETADWLANLDDELYRKLSSERVGLVAPRVAAVAVETAEPAVTLGAFIDGYIASRTKIKPNTRAHLQRARRNLVDYFGADKLLTEITHGDADDFREHLGKTMADNTVRRICGRAKQFFRVAQRKRLIAESPFGDMKATNVQANKSREHFVTREVAAKVLKACPDNQWKLLFALSRYGGLRCPSEHLALTWGDVDFEAGRIIVRSPKTEHHEGKEYRIMPLFPELRPYLQAVRDELLADFDPKAHRLSEQPVITRYRDRNSNLRTQLQRILKRAGLKAWPKLFQNLRASRATELAAEYPAHVAAEWLGHSAMVAQKHYWQVTDADFDRAIQAALNPMHIPMQSDAVSRRTEAQGDGVAHKKSRDSRKSRLMNECSAPRREPSS
jgi:integrase